MPQAKRVMPQPKRVMPQAKTCNASGKTCNAPGKMCNAPPKTCNDTSIPAGPFLGGITHLITHFEGFIEYLEFNTAKTDEFDEVLDNIAFMYSILMIIFHRNSG